MYHIRLDTSGDSPFVEFIQKDAIHCLISSEGSAGENPHLHIVVETGVPVQTIRNHIRGLGFKGNKSYSISTVRDKIKVLAYVMKDGDILCNTFEEVDLALAREYDEKVKDDISKKKSKNTLKGIEDYALSLGKDLSRFGIQEWLRCAVLYYKENELLFREFQVIAQSQTLYLKYNEDGVTKLVNRLYEKIC